MSSTGQAKHPEVHDAPACRPTLPPRGACWDLPAIEGGRQAEECAEPHRHEQRAEHRDHGSQSQAPLGLDHVDLAWRAKNAVRAASPQSLAHQALYPESWERACLTVEEGKALVCAENVDPSQSRGTVSLETFPGRDFL